jgi:polysaccharide export outer membrane protein
MEPHESPRSPGRKGRGAVRLVLLVAALASSGCGAGAYVWVDQLDAASAAVPPESAYLVASGDLLNIRIYDQDAISTHCRVSPDGKIAVPLVGEIEARGLTPAALAAQIAARLKPFIVAPSVTITLEEAQPPRISLVGEVVHPGVFPVVPGTGIVQALALAGGLTEYASHDGVFVLRPRPAKRPLRIRIAYDDVTRGIGRGAAFQLQPGDTVVVE